MRILFLQKRPLFPANTGGKIRTLNVLRHLARGHEIIYLCNLQDGEQQYIEPMRELGLQVETVPWRETPRYSGRFYLELVGNLFSPYPYSVAKDFDKRLRTRAKQLIDQDLYDLIICDFVQMARNCIGLAEIPQVLFQHNVEAQIFDRHARHDNSFLRRHFMALQFKKMRRFEGAAGRKFDAVVAVSEIDEKRFREDYGWQHVRTIDTAVDTDYFAPTSAKELPGRVVFIGSMDWLPNQDGVKDFVENSWPRIRAAMPEAEFRIVGRDPTGEVRRLEREPGVIVEGTVPDIRPHLTEAQVCVVPLRIGGGTRLKIYEAMAMGKAVVSTSVGAEGLPLQSGEHLVIADGAEQLAAAVIQLLKSKDERCRLGANARILVEERYSAAKVARQFDEICRDTVAQYKEACISVT